MKDIAIQRINPWVSIWAEPRKTIRNIVNYYDKKYILTLALLIALAYNLNFYTSEIEVMLIQTFYSILLESLTLGLVIFYLNGFLLYISGTLLKGKATQTEVRIALAWSHIPVILGLLLWIPKMVFFGNEWFYSNSDLWNNDVYLYSVLFVLLIDATLFAYSAAILVIALSEVQEFSKLKAFFSALIAFIIGILAMISLGYIRTIAAL